MMSSVQAFSSSSYPIFLQFPSLLRLICLCNLFIRTDELESLISVKDSTTAASSPPDENISPQSNVFLCVRGHLEGKNPDEIGKMKDMAIECATCLQQSVESQLEPLLSVLQGKCTWEEASAFARMSIRRSKLLRNRKRRKKQRQLAAEAIRKAS